jgi:hypothetical protein
MVFVVVVFLFRQPGNEVELEERGEWVRAKVPVTCFRWSALRRSQRCKFPYNTKVLYRNFLFTSTNEDAG